MTDEQTKLWKFYSRMFGEDKDDRLLRDQDERKEIAEEMRRVIDAPDDKSAGQVIAWWDTFDLGPDDKEWNKTATTCAAEIRKRWARRKKAA